jgi:hypothetical protein
MKKEVNIVIISKDGRIKEIEHEFKRNHGDSKEKLRKVNMINMIHIIVIIIDFLEFLI